MAFPRLPDFVTVVSARESGGEIEKEMLRQLRAQESEARKHLNAVTTRLKALGYDGK